jgi:hypothetical protein
MNPESPTTHSSAPQEPGRANPFRPAIEPQPPSLKPGYQTSEFWLAAVMNLVAAVLALLVGRDLLTAEESSLLRELALAVVPLVLAIVNASYIHSRGRVKAAAQEVAATCARS